MNSSYLIKDPKLYKGKYNKLFGNDNPIDIEIGMGKGDFIIGMAMQNPNVNYIGIEMYDSVIVRAVQKLENKIIPNLRLIRMDANLIDEVFEKEINTIYLNFSDPWPKKRHEKRRLTSHEFLKKYEDDDDVVGAILCGSYATNTQNEYSSIDVYLVLKEDANYSLRGNTDSNSYLIEYFMNTKEGILECMEKEFNYNKQSTANMFSYGKIIYDLDGSVKELQDKAVEYIDKPFNEITGNKLDKNNYHLWYYLHELKVCLKENNPQFNLIYYKLLNDVYDVYAEYQGLPKLPKTKIYKILTDEEYRRKLHIFKLADDDFIKYVIGPKDLALALKLTKAGSDHSKFLRQIFVSMDITAPMSWWWDFDTYKVATVRNSTSRMHKLGTRLLTFDDFSLDDEKGNINITPFRKYVLEDLNKRIAQYQQLKNDGKNEEAMALWREIVFDSPQSYNFRSTWTGNYEIMRNVISL